MTSNSTDHAPNREASSEPTRAARAAEAGMYLAAAAEQVRLRPEPYNSYGGFPVHPSRPETDPVRQLLALAGIGQALLELGERVGGGLADVADAVTGVQEQVGVLCDRSFELEQGRRRWFGRRPRRDARLAAADVALIREALADAASWCRLDECGAGVDNERLAFAYLALRERLGGGAS